MLLIGIFLIIFAFIGYAAWKSNWEPKATIAAVLSFLGAVWAAFQSIGTPTP